MIEARMPQPELSCAHIAQDLQIRPEAYGCTGETALVTEHEVLVEGPQGKTVIPLIEYCSWKQDLGWEESPAPNDVLEIKLMGGGASGALDNAPALFNVIPALTGKNYRIVLLPQIQGTAREQKIIHPEPAAHIMLAALNEASLDKTDLFIGHSAAGTYGTSLTNKLSPHVVFLIDPTGGSKNRNLPRDFIGAAFEPAYMPDVKYAPLTDRLRYAYRELLGSFLVPHGRAKAQDLLYAYSVGFVRPTRDQRERAARYGFRSQPIYLDVKRMQARKRGSYCSLRCEDLVVITNAHSRVVHPMKERADWSAVKSQDIEMILAQAVNGPNTIRAIVYPGHHNSHLTNPYYFQEVFAETNVLSLFE